MKVKCKTCGVHIDDAFYQKEGICEECLMLIGDGTDE